MSETAAGLAVHNQARPVPVALCSLPPRDETPPLVDIEGLTISFPGSTGLHRVVDDVDLLIRPGECVALVGESGSGKSVTARSLLNLAGPRSQVSARRLLLDGADASRFPARTWRALRGTFAGLVMQDALVSLDPLRPIGREVGEVLERHRWLPGRRAFSREAISQRVAETLTRVGIADPQQRMRQYAHQLSGGQRQRALIAAAIAAQPRLIIADEPTTALDASVQRQVLEVLVQRVNEDGVGLLLISHDLAVVAGIADRVLVMRHGRVVETGRTAEVLAHPRHPYTRQLIAAVPSAASRGQRLASARFESRPLPTPPPVADAGRECSAGKRSEGGATTLRLIRDPLPPRRIDHGQRVLEVQGLVKRFQRGPEPSFTALDDVSLHIDAGEVLGLVGESGSGKSTCARIILGLQAPDAGTVRLLGHPWSAMPEARRRPLRPRLQYIPQDPLSSFDPRYRVREVIAENLGGLPAAQREAKIHRLLEQVGLAAELIDRAPLTLSGGQRQRVAIARALAVEPALIVCDEPVSALDVSVQAQVIDLIGELQSRRGTALLFITHDLPLVQHVADRVVVLSAGRVVEQGPVDRVFRSPRDPYTRQLLAAVPAPLRGAAAR